jgi:hypothetical protein
MIALNDNALTTLDRLKPMIAGLNPEDTAPDDLLTQLINQASAYVEAALGRRLKQAGYTERHKGTGAQELLTDQYPITLIDYIKWAGEIIDPALYDISRTAEAGCVYKDDGWPYRGYTHGLAGDAVMGSRNLEVRYTAGYVLPKDATADDPATLPADLEGLIMDMVKAAYGKMQSGGDAGLKSYSISDVRWEWQHEAPERWQAVINLYRRAWL